MSTATEQPGLPTVEQVRDHEQHGGLWRYVRPDGWPSFARLRTFFGELFVQWDSSVAYHNMPPGHEQQTWTPCDQQGNPLELVEALASAESARDTLAQRAARLTTERNEARWRLRQAARRVLELGREARNWRIFAHEEIRERDAAIAQADQSEHERDHLREVNAGLHERIRRMEVRIGGAESELAWVRGEREAYKRDFEGELAGSAALRAKYGAHEHETMWMWIERISADSALLGAPDTPEGKALRALVRAARSAWARADAEGSEGVVSVLGIIRKMGRPALWEDTVEAAQQQDAHGLALYLALILARREEAERAYEERGRQIVKLDEALSIMASERESKEESTTRVSLANVNVEGVTGPVMPEARTLGAALDASWAEHAKVETCGECKHGPRNGLALCKRLLRRVTYTTLPPEDCPGPELCEVKP